LRYIIGVITSRRMSRGTCSTNKKMIIAHKVVGGNLHEKTPLHIRTGMWDSDMKTHSREII
jgi:hypothetical protein